MNNTHNYVENLRSTFGFYVYIHSIIPVYSYIPFYIKPSVEYQPVIKSLSFVQESDSVCSTKTVNMTSAYTSPVDIVHRHKSPLQKRRKGDNFDSCYRSSLQS